uniref:FAD dependent oxidoreductase domain-containing protein n=2 Tax=Nymphaea colorata TaxID=210225 RepID=A0A5K0XRI5_9MAGN
MADSGEQFDVVVVGAGIMGSCAAYHLSKRGLKTLLLERFSFLHHLGSSHGESRTVRVTYPEPYYPGMVAESIRLWREAESEIGFRVYTQTPQLDMGARDNPTLQSLVAVCQQNRIEHRLLSPADVAAEFGGAFHLPDGWIGVVTRDGGFVKPTKAVAMFQALALRHGAVLTDHQEVTAVARQEDGSLAVSTKTGRQFRGRKCVVTVGAWAGELAREFSGACVPVQPLHTTVCYWKIKDGESASKFLPENGFPTFACYDEPYIYGTPTADFPGLLKIAIHGGQPCDPNRRDWSTNLELLRHAASPWIRARFEGAVEAQEPVLVQGCMYSMTPDEDFVVDFLGGELGKDVAIACGFSGHGFKMGPVMGRILADLVTTGEAQGVDLSHFRLGRFKDNPKGNSKEYGDQVSSYSQAS